MEIMEIRCSEEKKQVVRHILESLPAWFEQPEGREQYHRSGIGRQLVLQAKQIAYEKGYSFMQVKTVQVGVYEDYDRTNRFYLALGFKEFEVFPTLWDETNPCQIYVMALEEA